MLSIASFGRRDLLTPVYTFKVVKVGLSNQNYTPASNLGYLAPPGQFFMGAKLFIGTIWMGNEGVLKKI